jgi:AcrR family transcriptional regulator
MTRHKPIGEDLRVKRTQKLIMEAMIELTAQKGFSDLTVRDITKYAGINRATFYRHYQNKFDLLDQYAQAVYELPGAMVEAGLRTSGNGTDKQFPVAMVRIFEHLQANAKFFRVMLGKNGDRLFSEKIRGFIQKRLRRLLPQGQRAEETTVDLYLSYISSGSLGAITWWLEHDMPYSAREMAAISFRLMAANLYSMFEKTKPASQLNDYQSLETFDISTKSERRRKATKKASP